MESDNIAPDNIPHDDIQVEDEHDAPTSEQEITTPYQVTIIYDGSSPIETVVASLALMAQVVPISPDIDLATVASACELSPRLVIIGSKFETRCPGFYQSFLTRGFPLVEVITSDDLDPQPKILVVHGQCYEHIRMIDNPAVFYIIDCFSGASGPMSSGTGPNNRGANIIRAAGFDGRSLGDLALHLCSGIDSFERIDQCIARGGLLQEIRTKMASHAISGGIIYNYDDPTDASDATTDTITIGAGSNLICAVPAGDLSREIILQAPTHPAIVKNNVRYVLTYKIESHTIDLPTEPTLAPSNDLTPPPPRAAVYVGWRINILPIGDNSARQMLQKITPHVHTGADGLASAWLPVTDARGLLPHIYPH